MGPSRAGINSRATDEKSAQADWLVLRRRLPWSICRNRELLSLVYAVGQAVVVPLLFFTCLTFTARSMLIIFGLLKGPVLTTFERYGDDERHYNPLPTLLFWMGLTSLFGGFWISIAFISTFTAFNTMGIFLLFLAYLSYTMSEWTMQIFRFPTWYFELQERTSRSERRRIAYMWLRSTWRMRLYYNSSDKAFLQWADFIILATVQP